MRTKRNRIRRGPVNSARRCQLAGEPKYMKSSVISDKTAAELLEKDDHIRWANANQRKTLVRIAGNKYKPQKMSVCESSLHKSVGESRDDYIRRVQAYILSKRQA